MFRVCVRVCLFKSRKYKFWSCAKLRINCWGWLRAAPAGHKQIAGSLLGRGYCIILNIKSWAKGSDYFYIFLTSLSVVIHWCCGLLWISMNQNCFQCKTASMQVPEFWTPKLLIPSHQGWPRMVILCIPNSTDHKKALTEPINQPANNKLQELSSWLLRSRSRFVNGNVGQRRFSRLALLPWDRPTF